MHTYIRRKRKKKMMIFLELLGVFVGLVCLVAILTILVDMNISKKWSDIYKGDGRDDK